MIFSLSSIVSYNKTSFCCRNEGLSSSATSGTFLIEDGPYYYCMLEILLGRLSGSLYSQVGLSLLLQKFLILFSMEEKFDCLFALISNRP